MAEKDEKIFHIRDLANLWLITDKNTLRVTLKRYTDAGILHRVYRGLYTLLPPENCDPYQLGAHALHQHCYVSTESVLFQEGYISQKVYLYTFIGETPQRLRAGPFIYRCRKLAPKYLFQSEGIVQKNGVRTATVPRAIADILYYNPRFHFDRPVDWVKINALQKKIGYPLTRRKQ